MLAAHASVSRSHHAFRRRRQHAFCNGRLPAVVLHEMLHVIGIGTLWRTRDMLVGSGTSDPRFIGTLAGAQCISSGGFSNCSDGRVPAENLGGSGTAEVHWRESVFDREVMTGFVEATCRHAAIRHDRRVTPGSWLHDHLLSADPFPFRFPRRFSRGCRRSCCRPVETISMPLLEVNARRVDQGNQVMTLVCWLLVASPGLAPSNQHTSEAYFFPFAAPLP